ncbi:TB2/DP1, HVA22 family-domain-containing protein [Syncephalis fuscata]|nr:TB2/DP1, HVA22 family-domain-containing protein [Syncephalis fuscata]
MGLFSLCSYLICYTAGFLYPAYASYKCLSAADAVELEREAGTPNTTWLSWAGGVAMRMATSPNTTAATAQEDASMAAEAEEKPLDPLELLRLEQSRWLTYWCVLAVWHYAEWILDEFFFWVPFYYLMKVIFTFWMVLPQTNGAMVIYRHLLEPCLVANESNIDAAIVEATRQARIAFFSWIRYGFRMLQRLLLGSTSESSPVTNTTQTAAANEVLPRNNGGLAGLLSGLPLGGWTADAVRAVGMGAAAFASMGDASTSTTATDQPQWLQPLALRSRKARLAQMLQQLEAEEAELGRKSRQTTSGDMTDDDASFSIINRGEI